MKFSQRKGLSPSEKLVQIDSVDDDLRNSLWSVLTAMYWDKFDRDKHDIMGERVDYINGSNLEQFFRALYLHYFKKPTDTQPSLFYEHYGDAGGFDLIRNYFFQAEWFEVYDFIEFVAEYGPKGQRADFMKISNKFLERENSGYRFIDGKIAEISSPEEVEEVESAIKRATPFYGVKKHLQDALVLMNDRQKPDFRNSIKESISAVESLCRVASNDEKATLGVALKLLEKNGKLHPALKSAFNSLCGYTNDSDGIRHSLLEESNLTSADARFMLVSCSAFTNYVLSAGALDA